MTLDLIFGLILLFAPLASLDIVTLTFPSTRVGTPAATLVSTLTNPGDATLTITSIVISGTNAADFSFTTAYDNGGPLFNGGTNCGGTIGAALATECFITVTFTPSGTGTRTATLSITDNAADSPQTIALSGTGSASFSGVTMSGVRVQ